MLQHWCHSAGEGVSSFEFDETCTCSLSMLVLHASSQGDGWSVHPHFRRGACPWLSICSPRVKSSIQYGHHNNGICARIFDFSPKAMQGSSMVARLRKLLSSVLGTGKTCRLVSSSREGWSGRESAVMAFCQGGFQRVSLVLSANSSTNHKVFG